MSFFPPVEFLVSVVAGEAIVGFEKINLELTKLQGNSLKTSAALDTVGKAGLVAKVGLASAAIAAGILGKVSVDAAQTHEVALAALTQTLKNVGDGSTETLEKINKFSESMTNFGFTNENTIDSMTKLVTATGSVEDATKLNAVAMDMARYKHIGLAEAAITLAKGTQGNGKAFKEFGITLDTTLPKQEAINKALTLLQQKVSGQAQAYLETFAGKVSVLHSKFDLLAESIGRAILPILTKFVGMVSNVIKYIQDNADALKALIVVITTAVVIWKSYVITLGVVNAIQKLQIALALASAEGIGAMKAAQLLLNDAMKKNMIGIIVTALIAVGAMFIYAWNHSETFRKGVKVVADSVITFLANMIRAFGGLIEIIINVVTGPLQLFLKVLSGLPGVGKYAREGLDIIRSGINGIGNTADTVANKIEGLKAVVDGLGPKKSFFDPMAGNMPDGTPKPFSLDTYTGAPPKTKKEQLTPLLDEVKTKYAEMNKAIIDDANKRVELQQAAFDRETNAYFDYNDTLFKTHRSFNDDNFKLDRDYTDKKFILNRNAEESIAAAQKTYDDFKTKENTKYASDNLKISADYEIKRLAIIQTYADKQKSIIQKSMEFLTSAFSRGVGIDMGTMFAASFTDDNKLQQTLLNQVQNGVNTAVSWWGTIAKTGVTGLIADLTAKLNGANDLAKNAGKLAALGYSQTFISQIVSQGSDIGNKMADAIISASPESQAQLKTLYNQIQTVSETGLNALATQMNSGSKLATSALTAEYAQAGADLQVELAKNSQALQTALTESTIVFNASIAEAKKTLSDSKTSTALTLTNGLADAKKTYDDSLYDMNITLAENLFDASEILKNALADSQKQFSNDIDTTTKDTMDKLKTLQDELKKTADAIAKISGTKAGVSTMANSPAAGILAGVGSLTTNVKSSGGNATENGGKGIVVTQYITNESSSAADIAAATVGAIKYGTLNTSGTTITAPKGFF